MLPLRFSWRWFVLTFALGACVPIACSDDGLTQLVLPPGKIPDGGNLPDVGALDGADPGDASLDDAGDGGLSRVLVGVTPNPSGDGPPTLSDVIAARLTAVAAGSRAVVIRRTPAELTSDAAWVQLESEVSALEKSGMVVQFVFSVVDGQTRALEAELAAYAWNDSNVLKAMASRIDQILAHLTGPAPCFLFGRDVDVFLAAHPGERAAFESFLLQLIAYARAHPLAPPGLRLGVSFSFAGVSTPDPSWLKVLERSDVVAVSYLPGLGTSVAGLPSNIVADTDLLVAQAMGKPIFIEALGYPSLEGVGGSDTKQALFLKTFFTALGPRRSSFEFVNIETLHDLAPERCAQRATFSGYAPDGPWAAYTCSLGLFTADGQPKPAWEVFIKGAAAFASP